MRDTVESLCQLCKLMDYSEEEKRQFMKVINILITPEEGVASSGDLLQEMIEKVLFAFFFFLNTLSVAYLNHFAYNVGC